MESPTRRSRRTALLDISSNMTMRTRTPTTALANVPDSFLTPSPDEQIIKQRGRKTHQTSQDGDILKYLQTSCKAKTPTKSPYKSPFKKNLLPTRCSPRKRLRLDDCEELPSPLSTPSPTKRGKTQSGATKRGKIDRSTAPAEWEVAVNGLAKHQLVNLLVKLVEIHPTLKQEINEHMPTPDIEDLRECLDGLKRNIYKSMPYTRWGSDRDAFCFRRVNTHLMAFKKKCIDQGKQLLNSHQWITVVEYVLMAWNYITELPDWDNAAHNKLKQLCYKSLASQCMNALKKGKFSKDYYNDIEAKLNDAKLHSKEIEPCIGLVTKMLAKL